MFLKNSMSACPDIYTCLLTETECDTSSCLSWGTRARTLRPSTKNDQASSTLRCASLGSDYHSLFFSVCMRVNLGQLFWTHESIYFPQLRLCAQTNSTESHYARRQTQLRNDTRLSDINFSLSGYRHMPPH